MESGTITDSQITASSSWDANHTSSQGRLHRARNGEFIGGWAPGVHSIGQWLQVDLRSNYVKVTRIATQGRYPDGNMHWVTKYNLQYSDDCVEPFPYYVVHGQSVNKVKPMGQNCSHHLEQSE